MRCVLVDGKCFRARSRLPPAYTYVIGVTYLNFDIDRGVPVLTPILAAGISITCYLVCAWPSIDCNRGLVTRCIARSKVCSARKFCNPFKPHVWELSHARAVPWQRDSSGSGLLGIALVVSKAFAPNIATSAVLHSSPAPGQFVSPQIDSSAK